jgi:hypothetical protein
MPYNTFFLQSDLHDKEWFYHEILKIYTKKSYKYFFIIKSLGQIKPIMAEIVLGCLLLKEIPRDGSYNDQKCLHVMFEKVKIWVVTLRYWIVRTSIYF